MTHKYKLGDYVKYYASSCKVNDKIDYYNEREGFINRIEDSLNEDGDVVVRYWIGLYIGSGGYIVREEAIIGKLKAPKNKSKLEYLKAKVLCNEANIKSLNEDNKSLRKEIKKLEKEKKE